MPQLRVTFLILSYNHGPFISEALQSAFNQDYPNMQIIASDDCSTDDSFAKIEAAANAYDGPHDLLVRRTRRNLKTAHLDDALQFADGELCVFANSDDISHPNRVSRIVDAHLEHKASVLSSAARIIDPSGKVTGLFRRGNPDCSLARFQKEGHLPSFFGAGMAWHREVFDVFGAFPKGPRNVDNVIPFRGLLLNGNLYISEPLLDWRHHGGNLSLGLKKKQGTIDDLIIQERNLSNLCSNFFCMLDDITLLAKKGRDLPKLDEIQNSIAQRTFTLSRQWSDVRSRLAFAGHGVF
jgi:glycosyltransferase involved in cell wall biosynthesis